MSKIDRLLPVREILSPENFSLMPLKVKLNPLTIRLMPLKLRLKPLITRLKPLPTRLRSMRTRLVSMALGLMPKNHLRATIYQKFISNHFSLITFRYSSPTISLNLGSLRIQSKVGEHFAEIFFPGSISTIFFK